MAQWDPPKGFNRISNNQKPHKAARQNALYNEANAAVK